MRLRLFSAIVLFVCMLTAPTLAGILRPSIKVADGAPKIDLETAIPAEFEGWRVNDTLALVQPSPELEAALDKIYNQTLSRTYVNRDGYTVMLSIAYGGDQSDALQAHMPEGCYSGQGFAIQQQSKGLLTTLPSPLPVTHLLAQKGSRTEPVTYWIMVGTSPARNTWEMKKVKLRYALKGEIPEGLLFRVSSISDNASEAYAIQEAFVGALFSHVAEEDRLRLFGMR